MTNEEFQKIVVEKLNSMDGKIDAMDKKIDVAEKKIDTVEKRFDTVEKKLDAVCEQTANLMEFRTEVNTKLDAMIEDNKSIHELIGEHEVSIRTLRRRPV